MNDNSKKFICQQKKKTSIPLRAKKIFNRKNKDIKQTSTKLSSKKIVKAEKFNRSSKVQIKKAKHKTLNLKILV